MNILDKVRRQKYLSFTLMLFMLAVGVVIGTVAQTGAKAAKDQAVAQDATPLSIPSPVQLQNSFSKLAKQLEPSVVNISTEYIPQKATAQNTPRSQQRRRAVPQPDDEEDPQSGMNDFFQRFFGNPGGMGQMEDRRSASLGSGVVVDKNGYIITNNHVVEKATKITVKFNNDTQEYPAKVIGTDVDTDLAVIKVDKKNVIPAKVGNSDAVQVGDWAIAIGSPFGFEATVTAGIVSALSRDVPNEVGNMKNSFQHFIQTDAAINPGNSGGPLANINGEIIGINTMIASRSGGNQGIGFAMPINTAVKVYNAIIKTGRVTRGSIGVSISDPNKELLKVYGAEHGVFIQSTTEGGPGEKAGLKGEDIVTAINGKAIFKSQDLIDAVADTPIGNSIKVTIMRDKRPMTLDVVVGDRVKIYAENYGLTKNTDPDKRETTQAKFGITIQNLREGDRGGMGFKGTGVTVTSVEPGSFADDIGVAKGDIVVEVNRQSIKTVDDVKQIQGTLKPGDAVAFKVMRQAFGAGRQQGANWQPLFLAGSLPAAQ